MSWEWRVFFPSTMDFDLWKEASVDSLPRSHAESRTDWYIPVTDEFGVKLRYGEALEIKQRMDIHDSGCEKWKKVVVERTAFSQRILASANAKTVKDVRDLALAAVAKLPKGASTCEKVRKFDAKPCLLRVEKRRSQIRDWSLACEQTDIDVIVISGHDATVDHTPVSRWRSICIEGGKGAILDRLAKWKFSEKLAKYGEAVNRHGYGAFVCSLAV